MEAPLRAAFRAAETIDLPAWSVRAMAQGAAFRPGCEFRMADLDIPFFHLGFSSLGEEDPSESVRRMRQP